MKKLIALCAMMSVATVFAADGDISFGCLRVDSANAQTIVSIPWVAAGVGENESPIAIKDIIQVANLTKGNDAAGTGGDQLYYYYNDAYKMWQLNNAGIWVGAAVVANGINNPTQGSDTDTLARGGALILIRHNPSHPFYIYGQVAKNTAAGEQNLPNGAYSLIAPPTTAADSNGKVNLNDNNVATWKNISDNDVIYVPNATGTLLIPLKYNGTSWGYKKGSTFNTDLAKIEIGTGVWFVSGKTDGDMASVEWK